jgi:hypothetical protein
MSKIPLKDRKGIKEAIPKAEAEVKKAADALGTTLVLVDNTSDLYEGLGDKGPQLAEGFAAYFQKFAEAAAVFSKNELQRDALRDRLTASGGRVLIALIKSDAADEYFSFHDDGLHLEVKPNYWNNWLSYYNHERLEAKLSVDVGGVALPLAARRVLNENLPKIDAEMKRVSDAYGSVVEWDKDQIPHVYAWLVQHQKATESFGVEVLNYAKQFATAFVEFTKNPDNKEAIQEAFKTNRVGFKLADSGDADVYWLWHEGNLLMQVKPNYWNNWLSYYNGEHLEKTL